MPTTNGRETAQEKRDRQRREKYAAIRSAITPDMAYSATLAAANVVAGNEPPTFGAGEELTLRVGRRTVKVNEGEVEQIALADALEAAGIPIIGHTMSFGIGAGRASLQYGVRVARA